MSACIVSLNHKLTVVDRKLICMAVLLEFTNPLE